MILVEGANNISGLTMSQLQVVMIFGIGALFLYIIVPTAILANEVRLARQSDDTSGASAVLSAMVQAAFSIVAWLLFVTVILFLVVGAGGHGAGTNPANGMWNFWAYDWITADMNNLEIHITSEAQKAQARMIILVLSGAKILEILVLGVLLLLTVNISMALPLYKLRRVQHYQMSSEIDISSAITYLIMFMTGMIMFQFIIHVDNYLLQAVFEFAKGKGNVEGIGADTTTFNILNDLGKLLVAGRENVDKII